MTKLRALLLVLGLTASLLAGASSPHLHVSGEFGLWNEEHDLGLMAALGSAASLLDAAPVITLVLVLVLTFAAGTDRPAGAPLRRSASRAPPVR
jgi:hypothetical protein